MHEKQNSIFESRVEKSKIVKKLFTGQRENRGPFKYKDYDFLIVDLLGILRCWSKKNLNT